MVRVTIIGLWLSLMLEALGELWLEIQSLFPHSLDFHVAILHYEAIIGLNVVLFVESVHICWLWFRV